MKKASSAMPGALGAKHDGIQQANTAQHLQKSCALSELVWGR